MIKRNLRAGGLVAIGIILGGILQPFHWVPTFAQSDCRTFPETGKTVCGKFLVYWNTHGGLAQQGYPLSTSFTEVSDLNGKSYTVQYFERAVFEAHPENAAPYDILLSQLGTFRYKAKYPNGEPGAPTPTPPPAPTAAPAPPTPVTINGTGQKVSDPIHFGKGIYTFHSVHADERGIFEVELVDSAGKHYTYEAIEYGAADVLDATYIDTDGTYYIKVDAGNDWTVTYQQLVGTYSDPPATQTFNGHGDAAIGLFSLKAGAVKLSGTQTGGEETFAAELRGTGLIASLRGSAPGTTTVDTLENISGAGLFVLVVHSDSDWTISTQQ